MRERIDHYLDVMGDYLWEQFRKDLEMSERWVAAIEKALVFVYDLLRFRK